MNYVISDTDKQFWYLCYSKTGFVYISFVNDLTLRVPVYASLKLMNGRVVDALEKIRGVWNTRYEAWIWMCLSEVRVIGTWMHLSLSNQPHPFTQTDLQE